MTALVEDSRFIDELIRLEQLFIKNAQNLEVVV